MCNSIDLFSKNISYSYFDFFFSVLSNEWLAIQTQHLTGDLEDETTCLLRVCNVPNVFPLSPHPDFIYLLISYAEILITKAVALEDQAFVKQPNHEGSV